MAIAASSKKLKFNEKIKRKVAPNGKNLELLNTKAEQITMTTDDLLP